MKSPIVQAIKIKLLVLIITGLFLQACISFKKSTYQPEKPLILEINQCKISLTGAVYMNIFGLIKADFMPSSIKLKNDSTTIYIDPVQVEDTDKADLIFITHNHYDHFSTDDIKKLSSTGTIVIGPSTIERKLRKETVKTMIVGQKDTIGAIEFEAIASYNLNSKIHKAGNKNLAYVITINSTRIYIAGDSDYIPEMKELQNIDVAILPIGEGKTAMNVEQAAEASNTISPKIVVPTHYELNQNRIRNFSAGVNENIRIYGR